MIPQLCVVKYDAESNEIIPGIRYDHDDPITQLAANPKYSKLVATVALQSGKQRRAFLWRMDGLDDGEKSDEQSLGNCTLENLCSLSNLESVGASR